MLYFCFKFPTGSCNKVAHTHIHIFVRQDQPLLVAEKENGKKLGEVRGFCEGTTYFCSVKQGGHAKFSFTFGF
jgi:hypothetical protein